jgi:predicted MFS family arabinose efflux permease
MLPTASYRSKMLVVLSLGWAILQGGRFLLSPLLPRITETLSLSDGGAGLALTAFGLVYAITQFPSGTYSDQLSRATVILPAFVVLVVSFVFLGFPGGVVAFVAGILLLGLGKGLYASPTRAMVGDLYSDTRGRALGIYAAGTDAGGLIAAGLAAYVLAAATWRVAFVPICLTLIVVAILYVVWNAEPYRVERASLGAGATLDRIVASRAQRERLVAYALFYFAVGGLINFYPSLLVDGGFSETIASGAFALIFVVGIVVKPVAGDVSDRYPRLLVSAAGLLLAGVGFGVIVVAGSLPSVALGTVLAAVGYKTQFPIADADVMEVAHDKNDAVDLGAARGDFLAAHALGPGFVGLVADVAGFALAFWGLAAALLASAGILGRQYYRPG